MRAYTPTSRPDQQGYFDLLVKSYEYGKLSPHLHSLRPGSSVEVRGPVGRFRYTPNRYVAPQSMGLVAGGTGLTPCLQVIRCVLEGQGKSAAEEDRTCFTLLFQNRTEEDILLREEIDALAARHPGRLRVLYFLSNPSTAEFGAPAAGRRKGAAGAGEEVRGYINAEVAQSLLRPALCPYVCVCGPSGFNAAMKQLLVATGHVDEPSEQSGGSGSSQPTIYTW
jgi:cytochrome-b5 reductase